MNAKDLIPSCTIHWSKGETPGLVHLEFEFPDARRSDKGNDVINAIVSEHGLK
jgi:hypothetical protein